MTPYYEHAGITIYHGDCRDVLPSLGTFGLLLTDPPYGIEGAAGVGNRKRGKAKYDSVLWEDTPSYIAEVVVPSVTKCLAVCSRGIITPGNRNAWLYPQPADIGCFFTPASVGCSKWGLQTFHLIHFYGRDPRAGVGAWPNGRTITEAGEKNGHPCAKPFKAWKWLLSKGSTDPTDVILDPFMGSGTTLRAAKDLNLQAVGIEIEERYCEIAAKRLGQEVLGFEKGEDV